MTKLIKYKEYELPDKWSRKYFRKRMSVNFDFALTTYCQAKCVSCTRMNQEHGKQGQVDPSLVLQHMDLDIFTNIIQNSKIISEENDYIQFCGELGDPMMHPQIDKFIELGMIYGGGVSINTNGGLRQPKWYSHIAQAYHMGHWDRRELSIKFGVDGADHDTNWKYREGVNWQRAIDNMESYFGAGGVGEWHYLIFEWNWHQIEDAQALADKIGAPIFFKFNNRSHGLISDENKAKAYDILEKMDSSRGYHLDIEEHQHKPIKEPVQKNDN